MEIGQSSKGPMIEMTEVGETGLSHVLNVTTPLTETECRNGMDLRSQWTKNMKGNSNAVGLWEEAQGKGVVAA